MSPYDLASRLIDRFGKTLGLDGLTLEGGTHSCALEFDGTLVVNFEFHEDTGQMILTSFPADVPAASAEPVLRLLMAANYTEYLDGGITLGLVPQTQQLALIQARSLTELDDASFERLVEAFVNKTEQWKLRLQDALNGPGAAVPAITASDPLPPAPPRLTDGAHIFG
jgi:Tir chaperone protein (CesT) family